MVQFKKDHLLIKIATVAPVETYFELMHTLSILINRAANEQDNDEEAKQAISSAAYWLGKNLSQIDGQMLRHMGQALSEMGAALVNVDQGQLEETLTQQD